MERRASWLADVVVPTLGLENVKVLRGRAEEAPLRNYDVTTARAVSALPKLLRMLVPLTAPGGLVLAMKGSKAHDEIEESRSLAKKLKLDSFEIVTVGENLLVDPTTVVRVRLL
jgi:16S rRNA (guanine527-N7)-methyltransferase